MDNLIGTLVFLLPGVLAYFWLQEFGVTPSVKHTPTEFASVAGLLWLPIAFITLLLHNGLIALINNPWYGKQIWTTVDLKSSADNFVFLTVFLLLSVLISFCFSFIWAKWGTELKRHLVNFVRNNEGLTDLSESPTVWDEIFKDNKPQVIEVCKIDKPDEKIIGCIKNVSRPLEPERHLVLNNIEFFTTLVKDNKIEVEDIFIDTKSGILVKIFNAKQIHDSQLTPVPED